MNRYVYGIIVTNIVIKMTNIVNYRYGYDLNGRNLYFINNLNYSKSWHENC